MTRRSTYLLLAVAVLVATTSVVGIAQQESIEEIRAKAEQGDADAQYSLGVIYRQGQGVAPDDVEAARWFRLAADQGLAESGPAHQLLQDWLTTQPAADLLATWQDYIRAFCETVSAEAKANLESQVMGRAKSIASATGGILGLGNKISASEQNTLDELAAAFAQTE